jgi:hypothetical protein
MGTGLTGGEHRSNRCATTQFGIFEWEDTHRDCMACIEAKQVALAGHPSDGENLKTSKTALECCVVITNDQANAANAAEAGHGEVPPGMGNGPRAPPSLLATEGADVNAQLAQAHELEAKLAKEYRAVRLLRSTIAREASARGERVRELG